MSWGRKNKKQKSYFTVEIAQSHFKLPIVYFILAIFVGIVCFYDVRHEIETPFTSVMA